MKQLFKVTLVSAAILTAAFATDATAAGKKKPADPLTQALQGAALKQLDAEVVRQLGQAIEVGAPLRLDQRTAFPPTTVDNFQPKTLDLSPESLKKPLEPGDYTIDVIGYCTKWSLHYPGRGLPYKLARLQGRQAEAIGALLRRGTLKGLNPRHLNAMAWRIQGGVPISKWRLQEREWAHQLIPEYEASLDGDFIEQTRSIYDKAAKLGKLPKYETMLGQLGPVGETVLDLQRARRILANKTLAAERMPDLLYGRPRDGLPRTLERGPNDPPSTWSEIAPGVYARVTIIRGNMGHNVLDIRITPEARIPVAPKHSRREYAIVPAATTDIYETLPPGNYDYESFPPGTKLPDGIIIEEDLHEPKPTLLQIFIYVSGLIAYPEGRPAQALIVVPKFQAAGGGGIRG